MKIKAQNGCDTGMCTLDVFLESQAECLLDDDGIWHSIRPLLTRQAIPINDVVDFSRHVRNSAGEWLPVFRNEDGNLMWWNEKGERIVIYSVN